MAATAVTTTATATAIAYQQLPITFRRHSITPAKLSYSTSLRLPNLSIKLSGKPCGGGIKMVDSAAGSYATALAELSADNGTLEATLNDMDLIDKLFSEKSFLDYFASPIVTLEAKRALIDDITGSGKLQIHVCNFLNILMESKRIDLIKEIINEFELVYNKLTNTELAIVSSVVPLEKQQLSQLAKQVQKVTGAKCVRLKTVIDESLVAGFSIRYGNSGSKLIDMSVKKQLDEIAAQLDFPDISLAVLLWYDSLNVNLLIENLSTNVYI